MNSTLAYYSTILRHNFKTYCTLKLQEMGLTQGHFFFLLYVGKHPNCSPKELSDALHMDAGHTNRTLSKLETSGFLIQEQNPNDRRAHILTLTQKGNDAFKAGHDLFYQWDDVILTNLTNDEKTELFKLLNKLIDTNIENHLQHNFENDALNK
jgi:DNA-binding MarR family transcriptional regulator